jgi:hypothetical protein
MKNSAHPVFRKAKPIRSGSENSGGGSFKSAHVEVFVFLFFNDIFILVVIFWD